MFISLPIVLPISLFPSSFFLFLRVTCKYGSHNSPLNNNRSHEIYRWSRARAGLAVRGPWEVRTKSPKCLRHMKRVPVRVWVSHESMARGKSPKFLGHMKLPSSSRAQYGSKTIEPVDIPTTCRASPQDFSKTFRPVWAP